jgi:hypothetical protein
MINPEIIHWKPSIGTSYFAIEAESFWWRPIVMDRVFMMYRSMQRLIDWGHRRCPRSEIFGTIRIEPSIQKFRITGYLAISETRYRKCTWSTNCAAHCPIPAWLVARLGSDPELPVRISEGMSSSHWGGFLSHKILLNLISDRKIFCQSHWWVWPLIHSERRETGDSTLTSLFFCGSLSDHWIFVWSYR